MYLKSGNQRFCVVFVVKKTGRLHSGGRNIYQLDCGAFETDVLVQVLNY